MWDLLLDVVGGISAEQYRVVPLCPSQRHFLSRAFEAADTVPTPPCQTARSHTMEFWNASRTCHPEQLKALCTLVFTQKPELSSSRWIIWTWEGEGWWILCMSSCSTSSQKPCLEDLQGLILCRGTALHSGQLSNNWLYVGSPFTLIASSPYQKYVHQKQPFILVISHIDSFLFAGQHQFLQRSSNCLCSY